MIRLRLPSHLCSIGQIAREISLNVEGEITLGSIIDQLEAEYPAIRGSLRAPMETTRRPFIRFFASSEDLSNLALDEAVPIEVATGKEILVVVGAIAGG